MLELERRVEPAHGLGGLLLGAQHGVHEVPVVGETGQVGGGNFVWNCFGIGKCQFNVDFVRGLE